ncbi:MAG: hypothetical protein DRH17_10990 [Deltaproteobacteria bacterium]|nr:MAG: hypothetical protein DRH17_10990 [Deltaproteobacteria bacterium]
MRSPDLNSTNKEKEPALLSESLFKQVNRHDALAAGIFNPHRLLYRCLSILFVIHIFILAFSDVAMPFSSRHYQKKISCLLKQLQNDPGNGKICNTIGFYFYKMGNHQMAIQYYLKAIDLAPRYPLSYNNLGVIYLRADQYKRAKHYFHKAVELDPHYIKAVCNLGVTCFKMKNYSGAMKWYKIAQGIDLEYVNKRKEHFLKK